jgi:hypothetical protein
MVHRSYPHKLTYFVDHHGIKYMPCLSPLITHVGLVMCGL